MPPIDVVTVVSALTACFSAVVAGLAWRRRPKPGATTLGVLMAAVTLWNATEVSFVFVSTYIGARIAYSFVFVAAASTVTAFFAFTLEYTGYEQYLRPPYVYALAVEPALVAILTATQEFHGLFWTDIVRDPTQTIGYTFSGGPGTDAHLIYAYALVGLGTLLVFRRLYTTRGVHRRQALAILIGVLAPWFGNALLLLDLTELGQAGGFVVTGVVVYWAISKYQLVDLTTVARGTIMDELDVGVLVTDDDERVTDLNPFCRRLIGTDGEVIGESATDLFADYPDFANRLADDSDFETAITVENGQPRRLTVRASALTDGFDRTIGRLLLFEDVTDQQRRREELQQRNEQLQAFASLVSHDLRNPLDVADGYVQLMRQESRPADGDAAVELDTDYLGETAGALDRIESIVDDVLTLAREGESATEPETMSFRNTALTAWNHVDDSEATLAVETDVKVVADHGQLTRIFENLFRNAIEHGGESISVTIGVLSGSDPDGFYVEDDGHGIPADLRDEVFESGVTGSDDGTGFGLAIVQQLASAHDWEVSVEPSDDGGARFEFTNVTFADDSIPATD